MTAIRCGETYCIFMSKLRDLFKNILSTVLRFDLMHKHKVVKNINLKYS